MQGHLYIISGCSGVGKGTLIKKFLEKNPEIKFSVSCTTRKPRINEVDGINYYFISENQFKKQIENNEFVEWAEFSGNFYGTKKSFIDDALSNGNDIILEIDIQGAKQVKEKMPEAISLFILPPSLSELENRLRGRNTETEDAIQKRLSVAQKEIEAGKNFDFQLINDNIENALECMQKIFDERRN